MSEPDPITPAILAGQALRALGILGSVGVFITFVSVVARAV